MAGNMLLHFVVYIVDGRVIYGFCWWDGANEMCIGKIYGHSVRQKYDGNRISCVTKLITLVFFVCSCIYAERIYEHWGDT